MISTIKNGILSVSVKKAGAELSNILDLRDGVEHLWQADPAIWGRHAPVLFPIVGKVENNRYQVNGESFEMGQHGFARDMEFELVEETNTALTYQLETSEASKKKYPFEFNLRIAYLLVGNKLKISYKVKNPSDGTIYFSIGAHPGFTCPFSSAENYDDYFLEFSQAETLDRQWLDGGLRSGKFTEKYLDNNKIIPLTKDIFKDDALIFAGHQSDSISLRSKTNRKELKVTIKDWPYLGLWAKPNAPFVCIEPWFGVADQAGKAGEISQKEGILSLEMGKQFECSYSFEVNEY